jgi:HK97 family phage major capsid protein
MASFISDRVRDIRAIAQRLRGKVPNVVEMAEQAVNDGTSVPDFQDRCWPLLPDVTPVSRATIDFPDRMVGQYSISRAICRAAGAIAGKNSFDGLEREMSDEVARTSRLPAQGFYIPNECLGTRANNTVGTATLGGNIVATNLAATSFVEILRNKAYVAKLGARMLDGLVGNVTIPRQLAAATAYWVGETISTTQSNTGFDQLTLSPKACTGFEIYSKQLLIQSTPQIDNLIRDDLIRVIALAIDKAALVPETTGQGPKSILDTAGISTVTCSTAGIIPTFANVVALESAIAVNNADVGSMAYLTSPAVRGALKSKPKTTISGGYGFISEDGPHDGSGSGMMNGYPVYATNQISHTNTVGTLTANCSSIYMANWSDVIIGNWASLDITIDPYTAASTREVKIYVSSYCDLGYRHPQSFAVILDALTS